ncbi:ABC transporter substrate-binding protein [Candidatus Magnetominusculus dajiuhuensis]|uniref:ABC transporter substrate-binding protein n=1 Tax=Candidatus Magnetominusculus dajiuhuensis TaxID=3137712 RepID=UPI003B43D1D2
MRMLGFKLVKYIALVKYAACVAIAALILSLGLNAANAAEGGLKPEDTPYYSRYNFIKSDNYLNIGVQPLLLPSGIITKVMSRDLILRQRLQEMGIKMVFYSFLGGNDVSKFFLSDDIQAGVAGDMPTITAASKKDVFIPAIMQQSFVSIVARRPEFIEELKGKRIGYIPGSTGHYSLMMILSYSGLTEKDVTLVPLGHAEMASALSDKKIFAFSVTEPTVSLTLQNYPDSVVIHKVMTVGYCYFSREFYTKHPQAVRQIVAAEIRAAKWIKGGRENLFLAATWLQADIKAITGDKYKITPEQIADVTIKDMMWLAEVPVVSEKSLKKDGQIASIVEFMRSYGKIDSTVSAEKIIGSFDRKLIYDILNEPVKYSLNEFKYDVKAAQDVKAAR